MKRSGSVTVFLALALTCCCALTLALTESARTAGVRFYVRSMADSAADSCFSRYHTGLWENYRLLGRLDRGENECRQDLENFMNPYIKNCGWYALSPPEVAITGTDPLTGNGGVWFEQEVKDYLKYGWINLNFTPDSAGKLWKQVHEAQIMDSIITDYGLNSSSAADMEKALMRIQENLDKQDRLKREARSELLDGDNGAFQRTASALEACIRELPSMIEKYDLRADQFSTELSEIETAHAEELSELEPENRKAVEEQAAAARAYADADGSRRLEIDSLDDNNDCELAAIQSVRAYADETEEYIEEAEDDDEDDGDGIDEEALWAAVADAWDNVRIPVLNVPHGIAEEREENLFESVLNLVKNDHLALALPPDRTLPSGKIDLSEFPSHTEAPASSAEKSGGSALLRSRGQADDADRILPLGDAGDLVTAAAVIEYMGEYLPSFTDRAETPVSCQLEYALNGKDTEEQNLASAVNQILAVRIALNFMYILTTPALREQAQASAAAIASVSGIPVLSSLIQCLITAAWARAEALMDLRLLLEGKRSALYKSQDSWMTNLPDVLSIASARKLPEEKLRETPGGISYETYLKFLLFTRSSAQRDFRTMDMIQSTLCSAEPDFRMKNCIYGMHAEVTCESKHLFTGLGIVSSPGAPVGAFPIRVRTVKAY